MKRETRTLTIEQVNARSNGVFNLKVHLPKEFDTRFIKKSITERDSFPLYANIYGEDVSEPIGTVRLAIRDSHRLTVSGEVVTEPRHYSELLQWQTAELKAEIDVVKQAEGKLNRLVLEIGY